MFDLNGKTALVTGASGGIGKSIAAALHTAGATVILSGTRQEVLDGVAAELGGERVHVVTANLSDESGAEALLDGVKAVAESLDILVCNAGVTNDNLAMRMKDDEWERVLQVNLTSTFKLNRGVMRGMMKKRWGRIINISSVVATMGNPGQANYAASKAGMIGMSKSLAQEVASRGITVNCISPGFIRTAMTDALNEEQQSRITDNIPAADFGTPEDIAAAALFLASSEARYVTGQTLHVNGGLLMV